MASRGVVPISKKSGGAELAAYQLARAIANRGHEVVLIGEVAEADFPRVPGLTFVPSGSRLLGFLRGLPGGFFVWVLQHLVGNVSVALQVRRMVRRERYDLVHAHGSLSALLISLFTRAPLVYTEQDASPWGCRYRRWWERGIRKAIYGTLNAAAFRRADRVAVVFESLRDELGDRWGIPLEKVTTIPNGADADVFNPHRPSPSLVREQTDFDRYCVFVGRLTPRKGPDLVLQALAEVEGARCVFVGDGPMRRKLEGMAERLGVADRVAFLGHVVATELAPIYAGAEFLVLPSVSEGTPLVAVEAMCCGTPVLATRISGLPDVVTDWKTGFLVEPGNGDQLAMALGAFWNDRELLAEMSENAVEDARRSLLWPALAAQYALLYEELSGTSTQPVHEPASLPVATLSS